jgi:hypothetical protein
MFRLQAHPEEGNSPLGKPVYTPLTPLGEWAAEEKANSANAAPLGSAPIQGELMKKLFAAAASVVVLAVAASASAALVPNVYDPGNTGCPVSTFSNGVLHLAKPCPTITNAAAQADITGFTGATFASASFTLASTNQCGGGSPRFNVTTNVQTYFLGCANVTPVVDPGTLAATYTITPATLTTAGLPVPTGTITSVQVLVDEQGVADLTNITFNGVVQIPAPTSQGGPGAKSACMKGGWKTFTNPTFKNQGQCVSYIASHGKKQHNKNPQQNADKQKNKKSK